MLDFIDIGGSKGGSFKHIKTQFGLTNGLAVDIDPRKVQLALQNNVPMVQMDATQMSIFTDDACKLVSCMHILEHLPDLRAVRRVLREALRVAKETIYIRGPMFYKAALAQKGVQFYWTHWTGHTCLVEPVQLISIMRELGATKFKLNYRQPVRSSNDPCIHSVLGKIDRHAYNPVIDPPKPLHVPLDNIYKEFELTFSLQPNK